VRRRCFCSKIISYAQGYMLLRPRARVRVEPEHGRHRIDVARRLYHSQPVPGQIKDAFRKNKKLDNLLLD